MYRIQYFCPREAPIWQWLTAGLIFKTPQIYTDLGTAQTACNALLFRYHSARVIDPAGQVVYAI